MPPDELRTELAQYACALINPPSQRHMFANKLHNLRLAISRMEPFVLEPGQLFSFWDEALPPTVDNGYRDGAMFVNHRVTSSVGGGLCQLSGLLYNLALLAGLEIVERHNHSIDAYGEARYIPLGRDATVAYGYKDLRFRNPHAFPVAVDVAVDEREAAGRVRGPEALSFSVLIETELVETIPSPVERVADAHLPPGEERVEPGLTGKRVKAWRVTRGGDGHPARELLSDDRYRETATIVRFGATADTARSAASPDVSAIRG